MAITVDPVNYVESGHAREDPIYIFALDVGGQTVATIAATFAAITVLSGSLAGIMAASRFLFAMARDNLLPVFFENVHSKYETPHWAIVGTGLAMAAAIMFLPVHDVAEFASGFNIMIFIVKERTKEIGIRKALGASPRAIISIILIESILITTIAGYLGLLAGVGVLEWVGPSLKSYFITNPSVSQSLVIAATFTLIAAGTLAGYVPAKKASKIKPIVALRDD